MGIPFIPVRGIIGSDYMRIREDFREIQNPYGGDNVLVVPAIVPGVAILHGFQADSRGNVLIERKSDVDLAVFAGRKVIATVEEVVPEGELHPTTQREFISWIHFDALIEVRYGAHPTACPGFYGVDEAHIREYIDSARSEDSFCGYLDHYVFTVRDHAEYLSRIDSGLKPRVSQRRTP